MFKRLHKLIVFTVLILTTCSSAWSEPITKEQGDIIINELKNIRQLLERQKQPQPQQVQQPPKAEKITVKSGGTHTLGNSNAPLVLIEYTDYQCSFCARFSNSTFPAIKKNLIDTGKVLFIQRDLPLDFHQFASKAAQAVLCAGESGKFWEMKELLFKNSQKLDLDSLAGYAKNIGLKPEDFSACLASDKYAKELAEEVKYAQSVGITGTPSFVLGKQKNGVVEGFKIVGALPYENFEAVANELLATGNGK